MPYFVILAESLPKMLKLMGIGQAQTGAVCHGNFSFKMSVNDGLIPFNLFECLREDNKKRFSPRGRPKILTILDSH